MTTYATAPALVKVGGGTSPEGPKVLLNIDGKMYWFGAREAEDIGAAMIRCAKKVREQKSGEAS